VFGGICFLQNRARDSKWLNITGRFSIDRKVSQDSADQ